MKYLQTLFKIIAYIQILNLFDWNWKLNLSKKKNIFLVGIELYEST